MQRYVSNVGGITLDEDENDQLLLPPSKEQSYMGRMWDWFNEPGTQRLNVTIRGVLGTASLAGFTTSAFFAAQKFLLDERNLPRSMLFGTGLGISATVLTSCLLPSGWSASLADWLSRWSYEGLQILTQFYLNAGCPIDGYGFWDPAHVPPAVKELATLLFTGASVSIALLSLRTLLFSEGEILETINDDQDMYQQEPDPIPLLESGQNNRKWFVGEQVFKIVLGSVFIFLTKVELMQIPELYCLGNYLLGHTAGTIVGRGYQHIRDRVEESCPVQQGVLRRIDKIGNFIRAASYGIFFAWVDPTSFIPLGVISGVSKEIALHKFQLLTKNDEVVAPFEWKRIDNIAKGALIGLILTWYISGMTDVGLRSQDYANIITYLSTTAISYPLTRFLAGQFDPRNNSRLFNAMRFYFVNHNEALVLPYMLIRSAQSIGDNHKETGLFAVMQNSIAWASLGLASGNNRALLGIRSSEEPNEMSPLAELIAWFILGSQGKFR